MNPSAKNSVVGSSDAGEFPGSGEFLGSSTSEFEATLRLIASLSAPEGLEERVKAGLRTAAPRRARIFAWPVALRMDSAWMRSAAAAAIVFVVIGGGWSVYSRVQPAQPARVIAVQPHVPAQGGFSSAGAMRTPQTLNGPLVLPTTPVPQAAKAAAKTPVHSGKAVQPQKVVALPAAAAGK